MFTSFSLRRGLPHDLLLGTDVQHKLGFALVAATTDSTMDLLTGKEYGSSRGALVPSTPPDLTSGSDLVCPSSGDEATSQAPGDSSSAGGPTDKSLEQDSRLDVRTGDKESLCPAGGPA